MLASGMPIDRNGSHGKPWVPPASHPKGSEASNRRLAAGGGQRPDLRRLTENISQVLANGTLHILNPTMRHTQKGPGPLPPEFQCWHMGHRDSNLRNFCRSNPPWTRCGGASTLKFGARGSPGKLAVITPKVMQLAKFLPSPVTNGTQKGVPLQAGGGRRPHVGERDACQPEACRKPADPTSRPPEKKRSGKRCQKRSHGKPWVQPANHPKL